MATKYSVPLARLKKIVHRACGGTTLRSLTFMVKTSWSEQESSHGSAIDTERMSSSVLAGAPV